MITTTDYSNRQVDLESLQTIARASGLTRVTKTLARTTPKVVAGIQKMLQRYVSLLLTTKGSIFLAPEQGTNFIPRILRGGGRSDGHIVDTFALASSDAIAQMRRDDARDAVYGEVQPDEQIRRASLLDFSMDIPTGVLYLAVQIENQAGDAASYVLPVPVPRS